MSNSNDSKIIHLGYIYETNYSESTKEWSDGCESGENEWLTLRAKEDGTGETLLFRRETEEWGPYFHSITIEYCNMDKHLSAIKNEYGCDVLLGDLTSYFPSIYFNKSKTKIVFLEVYNCGAAEILKEALLSSIADKDIAVQKAIDKLIEAGIYAGKAKGIVSDFAFALGWTGTDIVKAILQGEKRRLIFGKYLWRLLDVQDDRALIITEDVIDQHFFSKENEPTWETSFQRKYLNNEFLKNFSEEENQMIIETKIQTPDNLWFGTKGSADTVDKVFLLSLEEADKYFGDSKDYVNGVKKTNNNAFYREDQNKLIFINNVHNDERKAEYKTAENGWWLRSPGDKNLTACVIADGSVKVRGFTASYIFSFGGVRPALWINLKS